MGSQGSLVVLCHSDNADDGNEQADKDEDAVTDHISESAGSSRKSVSSQWLWHEPHSTGDGLPRILNSTSCWEHCLFLQVAVITTPSL